MRGTSPEGGGGCWSTALQSLANMWINGVGGQGNWEIYVFTVNKDVFFHILTIHSLLKLMLPVCFIRKGSLFIYIFLSWPLTCWILAAACSRGRSDAQILNKFDKLSPDCLSESLFLTILWTQSWRNNFPAPNVQIYNTKQITTLILCWNLVIGLGRIKHQECL